MAWPAHTDVSPLIQKAVHQARSQPLGNPIVTYRKAVPVAGQREQQYSAAHPYRPRAAKVGIEYDEREVGPRSKRVKKANGIKDEGDSEDDLLILQGDPSSPRKGSLPDPLPLPPAVIDNDRRRPNHSSGTGELHDTSYDANNANYQISSSVKHANKRAREQRQTQQQPHQQQQQQSRAPLPTPVVEVEQQTRRVVSSRPSQAYPSPSSPPQKGPRPRQHEDRREDAPPSHLPASYAQQQQHRNEQGHTPTSLPSGRVIMHKDALAPPARRVKLEEADDDAHQSRLLSTGGPPDLADSHEQPAGAIEAFLRHDCRPAVPPALLQRYAQLFEELGVHTKDELFILAHAGEALDLWLANARTAGLSVLWESIIRVGLGRLREQQQQQQQQQQQAQ